MLLPEWLTLGYLAALLGIAVMRRRARPRLPALLARIGVVAAVVLALAGTDPVISHVRLRDLAPALYLLAGYWIPAVLVTGTNERFERWLVSLDAKWIGSTPVPPRGRAVRWARELLEAAYLSCYSLMPIGAVALIAAGRSDAVARYWSAVLLAAFCCYITLPWTATRSPRHIEGEAPRPSALRRLNLAVLGRASVGLNTFPSGHAAASLAAALALASVLPGPGLALGLAAAGVIAGSIVGRYHYAVDSLAGAAVAVLVYLVIG